MQELGGVYRTDDAFGCCHLIGGFIRYGVADDDGIVALFYLAGVPESQRRRKGYVVHLDTGQVDRVGFAPYAVGYYNAFDVYVVKEANGYGAAFPDRVPAVGDDVGVGDHVTSGRGYEAGAASFRGVDLYDAVLDLCDDFRQGGLFSGHGVLRWVGSGWFGGHCNLSCQVKANARISKIFVARQIPRPPVQAALFDHTSPG